MTNSVLLFGGNSDERLVSVASAQNISQQMSFHELWFLHVDGGISVVTTEELQAHQRAFELPFHPKSPIQYSSVKESLKALKGKVVFLALHGAEGEDGTLQTIFETAGICFSGSGAQSSADCFNKADAKRIVVSTGVVVAAQVLIPKMKKEAIATKLNSFFDQVGAMVVKPIASGSSFGLHIIREKSEIPTAAQAIAAAPYDGHLAEEFLVGRELTVGVIERNGGLEALCASEVMMQHGRNFDYAGKYLGSGSTEVTPAALTATEMAQAQKVALDAHRALKCRGYSRTDMILTTKGPVFLETNTLPGLSRASFIPQQLKVAQIAVPQFVTEQLKVAADRYSTNSAAKVI